MAPLRLLVTGSTGQVGGELVNVLAQYGEVIAPTRAEMDLANPASARTFLRDTKPQWIVNAGAYTAVDRAESEPDLAYAINAESVGVIGQEAAALGATVLHYSTDYVFDGQGNAPYVETDKTAPLGVYGASKLAGEQALAESGATHAILRTSWVYGSTGKNFLRTILKMAREKEQLRVVGDQHGAPTWSRDLARLAAHIIEHKTVPSGVYHAAGTGETTWAGFAEEAIRQIAKRETGVKLAKVITIPTSAYPTPAARPANSRLNGEKLARTFGWKMMDWQVSLAHVLAEISADTAK
ncbi:dTDP-4-dehydrorhamnose reductase [Granulicella sibirica]|uniref:dTDP-4-dehydrorhamnose reductase n=1 Tax=Granulicella sibirica TaxID=2479048 RepID=A0A4Q0T7K3_9BACT|nr:dTDP-4-dehydrorhamnose reductase [Granulicella sibirica]RXH57666.1 dTDP-4-dehydrorhamnose reductase [Granulicella sibirica]